MHFQSLRAKFLHLLHPSALGRVDVRVENSPISPHDEQVVLVIDKELYTVGTVTQACQCLEQMTNGTAPAYWKDALHTVHDQRHQLTASATWDDVPDLMCARILSGLGWVDRRIGTRTIDKEHPSVNDIGSEIERRLKAIRQGFPAPASEPAKMAV